MLSRMNSLGVGFSSRATSIIVDSGILYSNVETYIVDGTRLTHGVAASNNATGLTSRSNIILNTGLVVPSGETASVVGFTFVRTPVDNWTTLTTNMEATLTVTSGGGGTIDGSGSGTKTFSTDSRVNVPTSSRYSGADVNNATARVQYDLCTVYAASATVLTAGTYNLQWYANDANRIFAHLYTANVSIDTTGSVYPDSSAANNATQYPVMRILSKFP